MRLDHTEMLIRYFDGGKEYSVLMRSSREADVIFVVEVDPWRVMVAGECVAEYEKRTEADYIKDNIVKAYKSGAAELDMTTDPNNPGGWRVYHYNNRRGKR